MLRNAWRLFRQQAAGGGSSPSFHIGRGRQRIRVRLDGQPEGYVVVAILAACAGYGVGRQFGQPDSAPSKGKSQASEAASAFGANAVQPYVAPLSASADPPTLSVLTSLSPEEVAAHPLLRAVGPYGLPQLPFHPTGIAGAAVPSFHLSSPLLLRHAFIAAYNPKTRTPDWCLEMLTRESVSSTGTGGGGAAADHASRDLSQFKPDPFVAAAFQAPVSLYKHTGFDRGHMVPAADVAHHAASGGGGEAQRALDETFAMSNVTPQQPQLNRGFWLQLEHHARKLAQRHGRVFVVSGPLWIPAEAAASINADSKSSAAAATTAATAALSRNHQDDSSSSKGAPSKQQLHVEILGGSTPGAPFVAVPTHFFKVILVAPETTSASSPQPQLQLAAFVVPNCAVPLGKPLSSFQVPLEHVELYAGWQMFARLHRGGASATNGRRKALAVAAPPSPFPAVRDLCAAGGCELKVKDFQFSRQQAKAHA